MKKNLRKQVLELALQLFYDIKGNLDNLVDVEDVLRDFNGNMNDFYLFAIEWVEERCSNGHYSAITEHGRLVLDRCQYLVFLYNRITKDFNYGK